MSSETQRELIRVGKTSLIMRYIKGKFANEYKITVGADLFSNEVSYNGNQYILQVSS